MTPVILAAGAVALGTALGHGQAAAAWPASVAALVSIGVAQVLGRRGTAALVAGLVALSAGSTASAAWRSVSTDQRLLPGLAAERAVVEVCGTVRRARPRSVEIGADRLEARKKAWRVSEPVRISGDGIEHLSPGGRVCARGEVVPARLGRDEPPLLKADETHQRGTGAPIVRAASAVRERFSVAAQRVLPAEQAGLLLGMTEGDVELISDETMEDFRTTGLAHLVAVSGSNVAVVLAVVVLLSRALIRRGRWLRVLVAVPPLVFFAFLTALEPSVLRATVSAGVALAVTAGGRTTDALRAAAFAFVVLVLISPDLLFHPGFQLSFGATLGIVLWADAAAQRIARFLPNPDGKVSRAISLTIGATVAAQAAVAPLLAWHFGRIPAFGGLANLVVAPLAPVVMVGGMLSLSAASFVSFMDWAPATMRLLLDAILGVSHVFARVPAASIGVDVLVGVILTTAMAAFLTRSRRVRSATVVLLVAAGAVVGGRTIAGAGGIDCVGAEIHALDVGQGTAVLVRAGDHAVLLDGGPANGGAARQLKEVGVKRLDAAVVSHPHADHMDGFIEVLSDVDVDRVIGPEIIGWGVGERLVAAAKKESIPVERVVAGYALEAGPIRLEVLSSGPEPVPDEQDPDLVNAYSLLIRVTVEGASIVAPGDLGADEQAAVLSEDLDAPILVAPHHGSGNLDPEFVAGVKPRLTLVTVGADNPYGHPTVKALRAFERHGAVVRTDRQGLVTVCLREDGAEVWTQKGESGERGSGTNRPVPRRPDVFACDLSDLVARRVPRS